MFEVENNKKIIVDFFGEFDFLRNDFLCNVLFRGELFPSAEHAYQAAKNWENLEFREKIKNIFSPLEAQKFGQKIIITKDWEENRINVLEEVQEGKFFHNFPLKMRLLLTEGYDLQQLEVSEKVGSFKNLKHKKEKSLGEILTSVRSKIQKKEGDYRTLFRKFLSFHGLECMEPWMAF